MKIKIAIINTVLNKADTDLEKKILQIYTYYKNNQSIDIDSFVFKENINEINFKSIIQYSPNIIIYPINFLNIDFQSKTAYATNELFHNCPSIAIGKIVSEIKNNILLNYSFDLAIESETPENIIDEIEVLVLDNNSEKSTLSKINNLIFRKT